jgi:hypothetical protein
MWLWADLGPNLLECGVFVGISFFELCSSVVVREEEDCGARSRGRSA